MGTKKTAAMAVWCVFLGVACSVRLRPFPPPVLFFTPWGRRECAGGGSGLTRKSCEAPRFVFEPPEHRAFRHTHDMRRRAGRVRAVKNAAGRHVISVHLFSAHAVLCLGRGLMR